MKHIPGGFIIPSAAYTIKRSLVRHVQHIDKPPQVGDVVYGSISRIGQHSSLENASGRIHVSHHGTRAIFVFGNRYAPDFYEGVVPDHLPAQVDLLAQSGIIGTVRVKNSLIKDPTRVTIHGYVVDDNGSVLNTRDHPVIVPRLTEKKLPRARLILVVGTAMNSGKSRAAAACCWALSSLGYRVRAAKVSGTASLKDILHMNDAGAAHYADFTYFGYPSTYLLPEDELLSIFNRIDLKFANNPKNYWVVEFSDGINQRETAMLLNAPDVRSRIHRLIFCASDAFGAIGGLHVLREHFDLQPHALSGVCSSSPLHVRELQQFTSIPVIDSGNPDMQQIKQVLVGRRGTRRDTEHAAPNHAQPV